MNCKSAKSTLVTHSDGRQELILECESCSDDFVYEPQHTESLCSVLQPFQREIESVEAQVDTCELRNPENGLCLSCPSLLVYDSLFHDCVSVPVGVPHCEVYLTETLCSFCKSTHFLQGNECLPVTSSVSDCLWYSADGVCVKCSGGFTLKTQSQNDPSGTTILLTSCEASPVLNCSGYDNRTGLCRQCETNFFLVRENIRDAQTQETISGAQNSADPAGALKIDISNKFVYSCREQNIDNCAVFADNIDHFYLPPGLSPNLIDYFEGVEFPAFIYEDSVFPATPVCRHCKTGHFLNNNSCQLVESSTTIEHCLEYQSASSCARCDLNYILTKEKYWINLSNF